MDANGQLASDSRLRLTPSLLFVHPDPSLKEITT
jgi:hypothetical protein